MKHEPITYGSYVYPTWANVIGHLVCAGNFACIVIYAIYLYVKSNKPLIEVNATCNDLITEKENLDKIRIIRLKKKQAKKNSRQSNKTYTRKLVKAFVFGAGGLRFKAQAGQIEHIVANGSAPFLRKEPCCPGEMTRRWVPPTRYALRCITASTMKALI